MGITSLQEVNMKAICYNEPSFFHISPGNSIIYGIEDCEVLIENVKFSIRASEIMKENVQINFNNTNLISSFKENSIKENSIN
jgi:hypothetical protein